MFITNSQAFFNAELGAMVFLQSEHGDIYRLNLDLSGRDVIGITITYFDTIAPSTKLCLLESGYLFSAGDCSNHCMYRFTSLGIDASSRFSSNSSVPFDEATVAYDHSALKLFCPTNSLMNLEECD